MGTSDDKINLSVKRNIMDWLKFIPIILTIITITVGAAIWASTEHSDIKAWTLDQDNATKSEIKESSEKRFVPKEDFSRIDENMKRQKEDIKEIKDKLDKLLEMLLRQQQKTK